MKRLLTLLLVLLTLVGCAQKQNQESSDDLVPQAPTAENSYADYLAAKEDDKLELLMSVQYHEPWNNGEVSVYCQDDEGGYYCYNMLADEAKANAMTPGTLIRVVGYKNVVNGQIRLVDAYCDIIAGAYDGKLYDAIDMSEYYGNQEELIKHQNTKISFKDLQVIECKYRLDGKGQTGDDIYIYVVGPNDARMYCVANKDLLGEELYLYVESLEAGKCIDIEGYLRWYNSPFPYIYSVSESDIQVEETAE